MTADAVKTKAGKDKIGPTRLTGHMAVAGLFILLIAGLSLPHLGDIRDRQQDLARKRMLLDRLEDLPKTEQAIRERLLVLAEDTPRLSLYRGGHAEVMRLVQRDIRRIATDVSLRLSSVRAIGAAPDTGQMLLPVAVRLTFTATQPDLMAFLRGLEAHAPLTRVRQLSVRVQNASTPSQAARLQVTAEVVGFRERGGAGA